MIKRLFQLLLTGSAITVAAASPPEITELARLAPPSGSLNDGFGAAVAIHGETVLVGAPGEQAFEGAAYLYAFGSGPPIERLEASDGKAGSVFGDAVALTDSIAFAGAWEADFQGFHSGATYFFRRSDFAEIRRLIPDDAEQADRSGTALAVTGSILVIGAPGDDDGGDFAGAVYVHAMPDGSFVRKISSAGPEDAAFGSRVAAAGSRFAVLAPGEHAGLLRGVVRVFDAASATPAGTLVPSIPRPGIVEVLDVAMDEDVIVLGCNIIDAKEFEWAAAVVFDAQTLAQIDVVEIGSPAPFSTNPVVAVSESSVLLGGNYLQDNGVTRRRVFVFDKETGLQYTMLAPSNANENFAGSIAAAGTRVVVGGGFSARSGGAVHLFDLAGIPHVCSPADLADPRGTLDLADVLAFVTAFGDQDPIADCNNNGLFDLFDITLFVFTFQDGCG